MVMKKRSRYFNCFLSTQFLQNYSFNYLFNLGYTFYLNCFDKYSQRLVVSETALILNKNRDKCSSILKMVTRIKSKVGFSNVVVNGVKWDLHFTPFHFTKSPESQSQTI